MTEKELQSEYEIKTPPKDWADILAHEILGEFCGCYAEAWPASTCSKEAASVAEKIRDAFAKQSAVK